MIRSKHSNYGSIINDNQNIPASDDKNDANKRDDDKDNSNLKNAVASSSGSGSGSGSTGDDKHNPVFTGEKLFSCNGTLKDLDFLTHEGVIIIGADMKAKLMRQIKSDVDFFRKMNIMDYSLLLAISREPAAFPQPLIPSGPASRKSHSTTSDLIPEESSRKSSSGSLAGDKISPLLSPPTVNPEDIAEFAAANTDAPFFRTHEGGLREDVKGSYAVFYIGIIDLLQAYDFSKKLERFYKKYARCQNSDLVSVLPPDDYAERYLNFLDKILK